MTISNPFRRGQVTAVRPAVLEDASQIIHEDMKALSKEVAADAASVLGYHPMQDAIKSRDVNELMVEICKEVGVKPYNPEAVQKYMNDMVTEFQARPENKHTQDRAAWVSRTIKEYHNPIPEHVLMDAIALKRAAVEKGVIAEFAINEFTARYDPILLFRLMSHSGVISKWVPIAIWDEPTFKG